jgi:CRP/FNR family transcriptional regulator
MTSALAELKQIAIANALRGTKLFSGMPPTDLTNIASVTVVRSLDKGDYLFRQSDPPHSFYIVQKGAINVHRVNAAGRERVLHVFRAGESLGEDTVATDSGYVADARAVETSQVLQVQRNGIVGMLRRHPELAFKLMAAMANHLHVLICQFEDVTLHDVETRLANWLLGRCPERESARPVMIELNTTKRVLAAELGTVSETFSRTLAKFKSQQLIGVKGKTFTVFNPSRLNAFVHEHLGV